MILLIKSSNRVIFVSARKPQWRRAAEDLSQAQRIHSTPLVCSSWVFLTIAWVRSWLRPPLFKEPSQAPCPALSISLVLSLPLFRWHLFGAIFALKSPQFMSNFLCFYISFDWLWLPCKYVNAATAAGCSCILHAPPHRNPRILTHAPLHNPFQLWVIVRGLSFDGAWLLLPKIQYMYLYLRRRLVN